MSAQRLGDLRSRCVRTPKPDAERASTPSSRRGVPVASASTSSAGKQTPDRFAGEDARSGPGVPPRVTVARAAGDATVSQVPTDGMLRRPLPSTAAATLRPDKGLRTHGTDATPQFGLAGAGGRGGGGRLRSSAHGANRQKGGRGRSDAGALRKPAHSPRPRRRGSNSRLRRQEADVVARPHRPGPPPAAQTSPSRTTRTRCAQAGTEHPPRGSGLPARSGPVRAAGVEALGSLPCGASTSPTAFGVMALIAGLGLGLAGPQPSAWPPK